MTAFNEAVAAQKRASETGRSAWVAANAGSGKTRVLTDRVARLLLRGTQPERILCLTFTKAAASEMQNRLYKRLGEWAMLEDAALIKELHQLGEDPSTLDLSDARTLFASAIETPGGLKIQTIHAFCDRVLKQFPLEAGVPAQFDTLDERAAAQLHSEILNQMALDDGSIPVLQDLFLELRTDDLSGVIGPLLNAPEGSIRTPAAQKPEPYIAHILSDADRKQLADLRPGLSASSTTDQRAVPKIDALLLALTPLAELKAANALLLTQSGKNPFSGNSFPTKPFRKSAGISEDWLEDIKARTAEARDAYAAQLRAHRDHILAAFANHFMATLGREKARRGVLEFSDLIARTRALLTRDQMASWVLFKLDGGIDHVLVDEAQDTSPDQWSIIEALTADFMAGGEDVSDRSLFVVGDAKQSIYSFQGASPRAFADMQSTFARKLDAIDQPLFEQDLRFSFRSARSVLDIVDTVFTAPDRAAFGPIEHIAVTHDKAGRVDLWPYVEEDEKAPEPDWDDPVDAQAPGDPKIILAHQVADAVAEMTNGTTFIDGQKGPRPVDPGDILILITRRDRLFLSIIDGLKARGIPVAGADRLKITENLAVKDIISLLRFTSLAEDDLSLAEVLRSPLCGLSEQDLFTLAHNRPRSLWEVLRTSGQHEDVVGFLQDMRNRADYDRPFELIEHCLTRHKGREKLLARLGPETEDALNELLAQALVFEQNAIPDLTRFIHWFETGTVEVKRDLDGSRNEVRVMTVHGAKGLEAPIVILPDTGPRGDPASSPLLRKSDGSLIWPVSDPWRDRGHMQDLEEIKSAAAAERDRLLYVALTRAESWLIVAGAGKALKPENTKTWYRQIKNAFDQIQAVQMDNGTLRIANGDWPEDATGIQPQAKQAPERPAFLSTRPKPPNRSKTPIRPSGMNGPKTLEGTPASAGAMLRGTLLHKLLEELPQTPPDQRDAVAAKILADKAGTEGLLEHVKSLLDLHNVASRMDGALHEVPFTADLNGRLIEGVFDLLKITSQRIEITDFKSNAIIPDTPDDVPQGVLAQMALYHTAATQIFPAHTIDVAVLWTETGELMHLPHDNLTHALGNISFA